MNHVTSPATDDSAIEQEIQAKGKTAPRVTPVDLLANIVSAFYFTAGDGLDGADIAELRAINPNKALELAPLGEDVKSKMTDVGPLRLLTFCVLVLRNGFTVTGESACASPENFDPEIGRKIARQNAEQKIWPLLGFLLKEKLHAKNS